jgi:hypothetical protein
MTEVAMHPDRIPSCPVCGKLAMTLTVDTQDWLTFTCKNGRSWQDREVDD